MCDNTQKQATGKVAWGTFNTNTLLPKLLANEYCYLVCCCYMCTASIVNYSDIDCSVNTSVGSH